MIDLPKGAGLRGIGVLVANASPERTLGKPAKRFPWATLFILLTAALGIADLWARWAIKVML